MQVSSLSAAVMRDHMVGTTKLLFKSTRINIEFTRDSWKQLLRHNASPVSAFIQSINIKADLALYITAHEEKGIFMDTDCQEICYQQGLFLILRKEHGIWYITDVYTTCEAADFVPVYFWTRIKRGCNVLAARVLICWRRLTKRMQDNEKTVSGGSIHE